MKLNRARWRWRLQPGDEVRIRTDRNKWSNTIYEFVEHCDAPDGAPVYLISLLWADIKNPHTGTRRKVLLSRLDPVDAPWNPDSGLSPTPTPWQARQHLHRIRYTDSTTASTSNSTTIWYTQTGGTYTSTWTSKSGPP